MAYDLNKVFAMKGLTSNHELAEVDSIPAAPFLHSPGYTDFVAFRTLAARVQNHEPAADPMELIRLNPEYYHAYVLAGDALFREQKFDAARKVYQLGLTKEIASKGEEMHIRKQLAKCEEQLKS